LPVDKQAQELTVTVASIYGLARIPYKSIAQDIGKFITRELAGLSALYLEGKYHPDTVQEIERFVPDKYKEIFKSLFNKV
jgi:hypothetical protein